MDTRSKIEWLKYAALVLPLAGAAATIVLYAEDVRNSLADIRKEQVEIRRTQATIVHAIETGNDRITAEVARNGLALAVELGRVSERTWRDE